MNRFKCLACGGNQYTSCNTAEGCIYCGHKELKKMETLEPKESEGEAWHKVRFTHSNRATCSNNRAVVRDGIEIYRIRRVLRMLEVSGRERKLREAFFGRKIL